MIPEGERPIMQVVIENIERLRKEKGLSVNALCKKADYSPQSYEKLRKNFSEMRPSTIQKIACALDCKTLDLFEDWS